jgi:hypothetical protein
MNKSLILMLSLFGLVMAVATVYFLPTKVEPLFWLAIFIVCAYIIAKQASGKYFLHGFLTSLVNCVWITGAHILLFNSYIARHPEQAAMMSKMPMPGSPRLMMLLTGPIIGIISGLILGLFAWIASKIFKKTD